jgi:hypothetical protein
MIDDDNTTEDRALSGEDHALAELLARERPVPPARFRGDLARRLAAADPGYPPRPARLRSTVAGLIAAGSLTFAVGALVGTGII